MDDLLKKLGYLAGATRFRRISERMYLDGDKLYADAGLNFKASWFSVYYVLAKSTNPLKITEIAEQIDFTHITVKNILRQLEHEGLVVIKSNPGDRRSKLVSLSKKGIQLRKKLEPLWIKISDALRDVFISGHPDINNILNRIENELVSRPVNKRILVNDRSAINIIDYRPGLKKKFFGLVAPWIMSLKDGQLNKEEKKLLDNPEKEYLLNGGFIFFAEFQNEIVGCAALRRLTDEDFELEFLVTHPNFRNLGIGKKLIERSISRCKENCAQKLWMQLGSFSIIKAGLFEQFGFKKNSNNRLTSIKPETRNVMCVDLKFN